MMKKSYICDTCHKHLSTNEIPCQAVFNKISLDSIPDELKDFKKLKKNLISKRINISKNSSNTSKRGICEN